MRKEKTIGYWKWFKKQYITKGHAIFLGYVSVCIGFCAIYYNWYLYDGKLWLHNMYYSGNWESLRGYESALSFYAMLPAILIAISTLILIAYYRSWGSYKDAIEGENNQGDMKNMDKNNEKEIYKRGG